MWCSTFFCCGRMQAQESRPQTVQAFRYLSGDQLKVETIQASLRRLEEGGYIKRPFYEQGQRGNQKIFIDKFVCTKGKLRLKTLSFADTTNWENPAYIDVTEDPTERPTEKPGEGTGDQPTERPCEGKLSAKALTKLETGNRKPEILKPSGAAQKPSAKGEQDYPCTVCKNNSVKTKGGICAFCVEE